MESERLKRYKDRIGDSENREESDRDDSEFSERIRLLLNDERITKYCMVDVLYYDFSVIPRKIQEDLQLWRDVYFIFGISEEGEIISKWVDRWELDCSNPVENGKVVHIKKEFNQIQIMPLIEQTFNKDLLSTCIAKLDIFLK